MVFIVLIPERKSGICANVATLNVRVEAGNIDHSDVMKSIFVNILVV